jgi:hypothetical protein
VLSGLVVLSTLCAAGVLDVWTCACAPTVAVYCGSAHNDAVCRLGAQQGAVLCTPAHQQAWPVPLVQHRCLPLVPRPLQAQHRSSLSMTSQLNTEWADP